MNAEKSKTANTAPAASAFFEKCFLTRLRRIRNKMMPAERKRTPSSHGAGITDTTSFMTTKLKPQIIVAATSRIL